MAGQQLGFYETACRLKIIFSNIKISSSAVPIDFLQSCTVAGTWSSVLLKGHAQNASDMMSMNKDFL